jgi:primosomal protein N' (replication factor Y) (superfamily II helicase)
VYATIILNTKQAGIGNGLTYRLEAKNVGLGDLVKAPLRKRLIEGIVIDLHKERPEGDYDIKGIAEVLSETPLLSPKQIETAKWMADYYMCSLKQALSVWLTGGEWEKLLPEKVMNVRKVEKGMKVLKVGKKQKLLLEYLSAKDWVDWKKVQEETDCDTTVLKRLVERHVIEIDHRSMQSEECSTIHFPLSTSPDLTPRQTIACKAIKNDLRPTLLFGVTGSGKTEIYAALIRDCVMNGKSAILLLPEILLTENFIDRFQQLIEREAIAIIHSRLTVAQRRKEWRRCREGLVRLVIGSRSALFSPLSDLGLIIIDEEHEWTYKNEQSPRYHAGKVAERMACSASTSGRPSAQHDTPKLLLGTATPSVESWYKAHIGAYQLVELPERYGRAALPSVQVVDLAQVHFGKYYPLSPTLINAIRMRLNRHEQCVLFLNRRGFATSLMCLDCRYRFEDPKTKLPYTVHYGRIFPVPNSHNRPFLLSHHTGETLEIPEKCPKCVSANLREVGAGTQRIESLLGELFPSAKILRADADTLKTPQKMRELLSAMKEGRADILLGTQSVVKGLDLPNVTLAAVLLADVGLSLPHFRAGERVFQLLTQLTGRSGRAQPGEVIIQTFRPDALEVRLAAMHDVRSYLQQEMEERRKAHYPPDTEMIRVVFSGSNAKQESKKAAEFLKKIPDLFVSVTPSLFSGGKVWYVFMRGKNVQAILKNMPQLDGTIDVDPIECL